VADLRVDVGRQCAFRGDTDIALPNLSFQLMVALIQSAPNVLSNDRLMELVWPGQVVSPETVNKRVKLLRDALGDDVREPRYIAGVRSRGYRLIAPVQTAPAEIAPAAAQVDSLDAAESKAGQPTMPLQPAAQAISRNRRWLLWSAAALMIALTAALAVTLGSLVFPRPST
jgi:DNA-binding winged helix-turn-helix (wHTH) protein